ncbi:hypothetical protein QL285_080681 [Trifolium repens]|nr:hypothetical protein QL285_080681 [Trifolium repens]
MDNDLLPINDLSNLPNLEELSIQNCWGEFSSDKSVGFLSNLKILRIISCKDIKSVPPLDCPSLVELDLSYCTRLESFPTVVERFPGKLKTLHLASCHNLKSIPPLMLDVLEKLDLSNCYMVESLLLSVGEFLGKVKTLRLANCHNIKSIPPLKLDSLETLDLSNCHNLRSIRPLKLDSLEILGLSNCTSLESFSVGVDENLLKLETLLAPNCHNLRSMPRLKLDSLKELDLSCCYSLESFQSAGNGLLESIKFLNIERCILLKSIPPLRVTLLEKFNLSHCLSLQSFPEIFGEMRNTPEIQLYNTPIKELPFPFQNLIPAQTLHPCTIQDEGRVSPIKSSHLEYLSLCNGNLSDEYWAISFMLFTNLKELHLANNQFTVLPKSMEKCNFLQRLILDNCVKLQEIKGIPPCLTVLSALNCESLSLSSKCKLMNQKLHEAGETWFRLPRAKIPGWFDHQCSEGLSISFLFRNKFPDIVLSVVSPETLDDSRHHVRVIINGNTFFYTHFLNICSSQNKMYHLHIIHLQMENFNDNMDKALLDKWMWNRAVVDFGFRFNNSGIHVLKDKSSVQDIQFYLGDIRYQDIDEWNEVDSSENLSSNESDSSEKLSWSFAEILQNNVHWAEILRNDLDLAEILFGNESDSSENFSWNELDSAARENIFRNDLDSAENVFGNELDWDFERTFLK